ncbi:12171_t:CDS:10 [Acaulospora morrowiae]|uniref:12171_t:CDS:1 n=1 Tax=Acaulospora morrowiae TaxID=94023 RepID=A0A9N9D6C8_9GLOM|nr:12171_t:CDS:10 [Acaulospora morrowiae]
MSKKYATVIGAGVSGLTTAVLLQEAYEVTILAKNFPGELRGEYASPWAGAHWRSDAKLEDARQQDFDRKTFIHFWDLGHNKSFETGIMIVDGFDYWDKHPPSDWKEPWFKDLCPGYRHLKKEELPKGVEFGTTYKTITISPPKYLIYLMKCFRINGGSTKRASLSHIKEAIFDNTDVVINCSGLGSKSLRGVQDQDVYSASGQTILVQLPVGHVNWTFGRYAAGRTDGGTHRKNEVLTYVVPRDNGEVVLGGTYGQHDYSITPDADIANDIIARCISTRPDLLPKGETKLKIIRHGVGLRPVRKNGIRIETEWTQSEQTGKKILICHNYGHGGYGWQSSYGASMHVIETLKRAYDKQFIAKI